MSATITIDNICIGIADVSIDLPVTTVPVLPELTHSLSFTASISLSPAQRRGLVELGNPAMRFWHHWLQVKRTQEKRRLARKRK